MKRRVRISDIVLHVAVIIGFVVSIYPVYWMFVASSQSNQQIFGLKPDLLPGVSLLANYQDLMTNSGINIYQSIANSVVISLVSTVLAVLLATMAGFAFAKYRFRLSRTMFQIILIAIMIPPQVTLIPLFVMVSKVGLDNTYWAIILPAMVSIFGVFLMRQSFLSFPDELLDAGRIDGLNDFAMFWRIVLPLSRPALSALAIITFLGSWTNLLWPLVVLNNSSSYTIPVALSTLTNSQTQPNYGMILLAASIATVPMLLLFLALRRNFVSGIMGGYNR
ncbi:MAG: carbohydrate ABC transporter permease [Firmicutes bacterium]|nr:carbohydrate ABC transporter permease [Bacillota bacterium]